MREIKVIANSQNKNEVYMSEAETFGELKAELINKGYEVEEMDFKEGKSRIDLKNETSPLPSNFMYKGELTSDLVIMITPSNTKIKSGAYSRKELYAKVKQYNLQGRLSRNFTQCSNAELEHVVNAVEENGGSTPETTPKNPSSGCGSNPTASGMNEEGVREIVNDELDKREQKEEYSFSSIARCIMKVIDFLDNLHIGPKKLVSSDTIRNWKRAIRKDYEPYTAEEIQDMNN